MTTYQGKKRCSGRTVQGQQCRKIALLDDDYCYYHTTKPSSETSNSPEPLSVEELKEIREYIRFHPDLLPSPEDV